VTANVVTVSLLTSYLRQLLDNDPILGDIWIEGEVSNVFTSRSGHVYFTMVDEECQIKCVLFRTFAARQRVLPSPGDQVAAHGRVAIYERDGSYQLYADVIEHAGQGLMALQFERLRQRLEADGLFDVARKRPLPVLPRCIGVVTSAEGAVWHDIQTVMRRRYPLAHLILSPAPVQGTRAPDGIVAALERLQRDGRAELVIIARGGGSAEDLACFNDERVARAVFGCRVPVLSAVGHETDWTIIDLVADLRAPTPSAAAELCAPSFDSLFEELRAKSARLRDSLRAGIREGGDELSVMTGLIERMSPRQRLRDARTELQQLEARTRTARHSIVLALRSRADEARESFRRCGRGPVGDGRGRVAHLAAVLDALDPHRVIGRGYAVLETAGDSRIIASATDVSPGSRMIARISDGILHATVDRIDAVRGVGHNAGS